MRFVRNDGSGSLGGSLPMLRRSEINKSMAACVAFLLSVLCCSATAQEPLRMKVNLVNVTFNARDAECALVGDLTQDEIELFEDAVPQHIAHFTPASDAPLTMGILLDVSGSQDHFTKQHQHDLEMFLKEVLRPQDKVFLVCFGNHLRLMSDFTNQPQVLLNGLNDFRKSRGRYPELGPNEQRDLGTAFYDAIYYSVTEKMAGATGRRALLMFSDGEDNSSSHDMMTTIEAAQAANTQVYTIRYTETNHGKLTARNQYGTRVMDRVAKDTGAQSIDAAQTDPKLYFQQIAGELRSSYELGYYPTDTTRDGTFRKISVKPLRPGVTIHARTGYFSR